MKSVCILLTKVHNLMCVKFDEFIREVVGLTPRIHFSPLTTSPLVR